jgi:hypothetical protein
LSPPLGPADAPSLPFFFAAMILSLPWEGRAPSRDEEYRFPGRSS